MRSDGTRSRDGWAAIAWAPYSRRSEMFARELGGTLHCIHYLRFQSPLHAPFKYVLQAIHTLSVLFAKRPRAVHVQNPPFVCGLVVDLYCRLTGSRFVIEHHSAAFARTWDWARPLQRYAVRRAATNIVTSEHWADIVGSWKGRALVMHDPFLDLPEGKPYPVGPGPTVAFLGTFAPDEPLEAVLDAARSLPDVRFSITGDTRKLGADVRAGAPANVTFTGFLDPAGEYLGLLRAVNLAMVLTTRDHTLQLAGCEAISVGTPLVTSDWPYLRELFGAATVFVAPSGEAIARGVSEALRRRAELAGEIERFRAARRRDWDLRLAQLRAAVAGEAEARQRQLVGKSGAAGGADEREGA
jgi:glycosyltransferase involved in cell wall biosynthesis